MTTTTEIDFDQFMAEPARALSPECDFGVWWRATENPGDGVFRVSVVHDTGEIYALGFTGEFRNKAVVLATLDTSGCVDLDRAGCYREENPDCVYEEAERILDGWAEVCGKPGSLLWVRDRLRDAS